MRVVIPYDGSPSASNAVDYVVDFSRRVGAETVSVSLVNVQDAAVGVTGFLARDAADLAAQLTATLRAEGARLLASPVEKLEGAKIAVKSTVLIGEPAGEIAAFADSQRAEAIVMGTRGLGAVTGLVVGSVASKVVHLVKVPVTLVK